jgi:hypothetical protein
MVIQWYSYGELRWVKETEASNLLAQSFFIAIVVHWVELVGTSGPNRSRGPDRHVTAAISPLMSIDRIDVDVEVAP